MSHISGRPTAAAPRTKCSSILDTLVDGRFGPATKSVRAFQTRSHQQDTDGVPALSVDETNVIIPVRLNITTEQLRSRSPMHADRIATLSNIMIDRVVEILSDDRDRNHDHCNRVNTDRGAFRFPVPTSYRLNR